MRPVIAAASFALVGLALSSCGTNTPPPVYVEASWQVRCLRFDGTPLMGCTEPAQRDIFAYNGDMQQRVTCQIREMGAVRTINFTAAGRSEGVAYSISLQNASIPAEGGAPSGACTFSFSDGNTYSAPCGPAEPTAAQPCQIRQIRFGEFEGSPTMQTEIYCVEAPATVDSTIHRGATLPGSGMGQEYEPFVVTFYDCPVN